MLSASKGLTPKRRIKQPMAKALEVAESHKSSLSQLSPAYTQSSAIHHKSKLMAAVDQPQSIPKTNIQLDQGAKTIPPRSTQVAGTAIIQGTKSAGLKQGGTGGRGATIKQR